TLTLGSAATLNLSSPFAVLTGDVINLGTISLDSGFFSILSVSSSGAVSNQGLVSVSNGTLDIATDTLTNAGTIDIGSGGDLLLEPGVTFSNSGGVTLETDGTLTISGSLTLADLQTSGITGNGGTIGILGTLDLQAGTLDLAASGLLSNFLV